MKRVYLATAIAALTVGAAADAAEDPYSAKDGSWVSLNGTIANPQEKEFTLDYGQGQITVQVDAWSDYAEVHDRLDGDRATVYGKVDDDLYNIASIEASSIYVDSLNTYYYGNKEDEDGSVIPYTWSASESENQMVLYGTVTEINRDEGEFTVDKGTRKVTVDTDDMLYQPLDDVGFQQVSEGEYVSVTGTMDNEFFDGRALDASDVTTLVGENAD